jgi:hypothetical protein
MVLCDVKLKLATILKTKCVNLQMVSPGSEVAKRGRGRPPRRSADLLAGFEIKTEPDDLDGEAGSGERKSLTPVPGKNENNLLAAKQIPHPLVQLYVPDEPKGPYLHNIKFLLSFVQLL